MLKYNHNLFGLIFRSYFFRFFEIFLKFSVIFLLPFLFNFEIAGKVQLFLTSLFISSVFLRFGLENFLLKRVNDLNYNLKVAQKIILNIFLKLFLSYITFYILIIILKNNLDYLNTNFLLNNHLILILLSSFFFSLITIFASGLRGMGFIQLSQFFSGSYWALILALILLTFKFFNLNNINLLFSLFTISLFLITPVAIYLFYVNSKKIKLNTLVVNKFSFNKLSLYFQSVNNVLLNWLPILFFGYNYGEELSGIFSTQYRAAFGIFNLLNVIDIISYKELSINFQKNNFIILRRNFFNFLKIKSILVIILSFIISFIFFKYHNNFEFLNLYFLVFFITIMLVGLLGPINSLSNISNNENALSLTSLLNIVIFSVAGFFIYQLKINYYLMILGISFFVSNLIIFAYINIKLFKKNE